MGKSIGSATARPVGPVPPASIVAEGGGGGGGGIEVSVGSRRSVHEACTNFCCPATLPCTHFSIGLYILYTPTSVSKIRKSKKPNPETHMVEQKNILMALYIYN